MHLSISTTLAVAFFSSMSQVVFASVPIFGQCGPAGYGGPTDCVAGTYCNVISPSYSSCFPTGVPVTTITSIPSGTPGGTVGRFGQCGGIGWTGPTVCASPYTCQVSNAYYSQCL